MQFCTPIITTAGKDAGINVIFGQGTLEFNRVVIGNGRIAPADIAAASDGASEVIDAELVGYESQGDSMLLHFTFNNKELEKGFDWTEYGVFAKYTPNDGTAATTILYCYAYDTTESPESVPAFTGSTSYYKAKFDLGVSVGNAELVTVNLGDYTDFVAKEELQAHEANTNNPHGVTKAQVGLSNVENVSVNDARPTFTEAASLVNIVSGETATGLWGKVKKAISTLISHLSASNPHSITPSKIGAAASTHNHSASEITTGVLSVARGGTGGNTGVVKTAFNCSFSSVTADRYRTIRTLNLPAGTWIVMINAWSDNWGVDGDIELMLTSKTFSNTTSVEDFYGYHQTHIRLPQRSMYEDFQCVFVVNSTGQNLYITVCPSKTSRWAADWYATRII